MHSLMHKQSTYKWRNLYDFLLFVGYTPSPILNFRHPQIKVTYSSDENPLRGICNIYDMNIWPWTTSLNTYLMLMIEMITPWKDLLSPILNFIKNAHNFKNVTVEIDLELDLSSGSAIIQLSSAIDQVKIKVTFYW